MENMKLTEKIIGCAYRVYNRMGFGFLESVYEKCMLIELSKNPGPEGPALSSPLKGGQAPSIHETGQPVEPVLPVGRLLAGING